MLIAEEFVLLCLRPNGRLARLGHFDSLAAGPKGALLAELLIGGHLESTDDAIGPTGTRPDDPLLSQVLDNTAAIAGKTLTSARVRSIKGAGWNEVADKMVAAGLIGPRRFPPVPARWSVLDAPTHERIVAQVRSAAVGNSPLDERTAILLALAGHCQALEIVAPDRADRETAKKRIAAATESVPGLKTIALAAKFGTSGGWAGAVP